MAVPHVVFMVKNKAKGITGIKNHVLIVSSRVRDNRDGTCRPTQ